MNITINLNVPDLSTIEPRQPSKFYFQQGSGTRQLGTCEMTAREFVAVTDAIADALPDVDAAAAFNEYVHGVVEAYNAAVARAMEVSVERMARAHALHTALPTNLVVTRP